MKDKVRFIRLPLLLIVLFFVGRLAMGAAGASYDAANRVFSMVPNTIGVAGNSSSP